ncbi:MAG: efflux RND transporter permease subunit [Pseudomonadota bacterium]|nr:efflux RND transporter permease subunit [Pseudomonadota bacterium]
MWLTRISIQNPVFTSMLMLALMVLGIASWQRIGVEEFPNVEFPFVVVYTDYVGASPEIVEAEVTRKIEDSVNTIAGVKQVTSISREGRSTVIIEFNLNVPATLAVQDVRDKIAQTKPQLHADIEDSLIERYDPSAVPVVSVAFRSDSLSMRELSTYLDQQVVKRLQTLHGVGRVNLLGTVKRQIRIELHPQQLESLGIGVDQLIQVLKTENMQLPTGTLNRGLQELMVQVDGRLQQPQDFGRLIISRQNNAPIYLADVATIHDDQAEMLSAALINGVPAIGMDIIKTSGANVIEVVDRSYAELEVIRTLLPAGIEMTIVADSARSIRASLKDVVRTMLEGGVLAILIVLLFLGSWRSTVITALTLPISLLGTLAVIWAFGFSLNMMTLLAMALCVGLLIDDAIVVRENIVRHAALGKNHRQAALDGTQEIGLAVLATTFVIVAVFLPVAFMGGIIGRFFYQFGVAVSAAVLISTLVAFTLDPMLSSVWPDQPKPEAQRGRFQRALDHFGIWQDRLAKRYRRLLRWSLQHQLSTLALALASLVAALILAGSIGKEFVPTPDLGEMSVKFETPIDSSLRYTQLKATQVDAVIREFPEVQATYTTINSLSSQGKHKAEVRIQLKPKRERQRGLEQLNSAVRQRLQQIAGITITSVASAKEAVTGGLKPIMISIRGTNLDELQRISDDFMRQISQVDGIVDLESSLKAPKPTLSIQLNRQAASDAGLSVGQIGQVLRPLIAGQEVTTWQDPAGDSFDVLIRLPAHDRQTISDIQQLRLASNKIDPATGQPLMVTLGQVATFQQVEGASQINRRKLFREVLIQANVEGRPAGDIGDDIARIQAATDLPAGYSFMIEGANKDMQESIGYAVSALILAVVFIYMLLASQFNSFLHPAAIMASLPLSLIGVFLALFMFGSTLNIFSMIGIIMLMGLVSKNAILLIDFIKEALARGDSREQAILAAGETRLRPILMTTAAMVMGMLPLALGLGDGAEQRAPMAHAIIGGVLTSTLLTLVVVPVIYTYLDDAKHAMLKLWHKMVAR